MLNVDYEHYTLTTLGLLVILVLVKSNLAIYVIQSHRIFYVLGTSLNKLIDMVCSTLIEHTNV